MSPKYLCLLIMAVVACAAAQNEDEFNIPFENDNQFPPDNNLETDGNLTSTFFDDVATQTSAQPAEVETLPTTDKYEELLTDGLNYDTTAQTSAPLFEDTTTTEEDSSDSYTTHASTDNVVGMIDAEIGTSEEPVDEVANLSTTEPDMKEPTEEGTSGDGVNIVTTEASVFEEVKVQMPTTDLHMNEATEVVASEELVDAITTQTIVSLVNGVQLSTTELISEEPVEAVTTEPSALINEDVQLPTTELIPEEPLDAAMSFSIPLAKGVELTPAELDVNEVDEGNANNLGDVASEPSVSIGGDVQATDVSTSADSVDTLTTDASIPLVFAAEIPTAELDDKETTNVDSTTAPVESVTTEPSPLPLNVELQTTNEKDDTDIGTLEHTIDAVTAEPSGSPTIQTDEKSVIDGTAITPVNPIDQSEFSIRSNKANTDAVSPLTLAEAPRETEMAKKVESPKETEADNKEADVSVGATTSASKGAGIDRSVIGVIVAGMVLVVAGITIKRNWSSIKNKFSSSPRPANDRTNHTNGLAPEEVPLQDKDNKNPSPV